MVDIYQYLDAWFEGKHSDSLQHIGCYRSLYAAVTGNRE